MKHVRNKLKVAAVTQKLAGLDARAALASKKEMALRLSNVYDILKAAEHGQRAAIMRPGFNVWPPKELADTDADELGGDHFADDWDAVLIREKAYAAVTTPSTN